MKKLVLVLGCLLLAGCQPQKAGPSHLKFDSISYNRALQNSIDSQLLLNIVRLRYRDTPTFLQVGLISAAYESTAEGAVGFNFNSINKSASTVNVSPSFSVERKEKPTTTYQPVRGEGFVREFLSPIGLQVMALLNHSGWKIDRIMRCCVQRLNGVNNAATASGPTPKEAPEYQDFLEITSLFSALEKEDAIDIVMEVNHETKKPEFFLYIEKDVADPSLVRRLWNLLDIGPDHYKIRLISYHGKRHARDEIVVDTRSPLSLLYYLSLGIHVPDIDQIEGKVTVTRTIDGMPFNWDDVLQGIITIHSGPFCGREPSAMVCYRGTYFYIDDSDLDSKSTFSLLSQLLALQIKCPEIPFTAFTIPLN